MEWSDMLSGLVGLQGMRLMAQVTLLEGDRMPMLTVFGRLGGGPSEQVGSGESVILSLESAHQGNNGLMIVQRSHFRDAWMPTEHSMVISYDAMQIVLTGSKDDHE